MSTLLFFPLQLVSTDHISAMHCSEIPRWKVFAPQPSLAGGVLCRIITLHCNHCVHTKRVCYAIHSTGITLPAGDDCRAKTCHLVISDKHVQNRVYLHTCVQFLSIINNVFISAPGVSVLHPAARSGTSLQVFELSFCSFSFLTSKASNVISSWKMHRI